MILLVKNETVNSLVNELKTLLRDNYLICIDGRCGSGKTTIGNILSEQLNADIIHIDNFYLPFNKRKENWKKIIAGNMDFERLNDEVIVPYRNKKFIKTKGYNPRKDEFFDLNEIQSDRPLIIEGSYSSYFNDYDYKLFLTCDKDVQKTRLMKREGDNFINFEKLWIVKEEEFFAYYKTQENVNKIIDTSELF